MFCISSKGMRYSLKRFGDASLYGVSIQKGFADSFWLFDNVNDSTIVQLFCRLWSKWQ